MASFRSRVFKVACCLSVHSLLHFLSTDGLLALIRRAYGLSGLGTSSTGSCCRAISVARTTFFPRITPHWESQPSCEVKLQSVPSGYGYPASYLTILAIFSPSFFHQEKGKFVFCVFFIRLRVVAFKCNILHSCSPDIISSAKVSQQVDYQHIRLIK